MTDDEGDDEEKIVLNESAWAREMTRIATPARVLYELRTLRNLTLDELAARSGIPKGNLSKMEHGKRPIGPRSAKRLAEALTCDHRQFL